MGEQYAYQSLMDVGDRRHVRHCLDQSRIVVIWRSCVIGCSQVFTRRNVPALVLLMDKIERGDSRGPMRHIAILRFPFSLIDHCKNQA